MLTIHFDAFAPGDISINAFCLFTALDTLTSSYMNHKKFKFFFIKFDETVFILSKTP